MTRQGRQIVLREWKLDDLEGFRQWMEPGHDWQQTDGPYYELASEAEIAERIEKYRLRITATSQDCPPNSLVIAPCKSLEMIGLVNWGWLSRETYWPEVGISIFDSNRWRSGIGFEALGLWTECLFEHLPEIVRVDLRTWSGHLAMVRLALKLGYSEEARFRKARIVKGQYYDGLGFGVLRDEWVALYPNGFAASLQLPAEGSSR